MAIVRDGDTFCTTGFFGKETPDESLAALQRRCLDQQRPRNLALAFPAGQGDGKNLGSLGSVTTACSSG